MSKPFGNSGSVAGPGTTGPSVGGSSVLGKLIGGGGRARGKKEKLPAYIDHDLLNRLRNTVVALQRAPHAEDAPLSMSSFVEAAVLEAIERAERECNDGRPFPQRSRQQLKSGPPISV